MPRQRVSYRVGPNGVSNTSNPFRRDARLSFQFDASHVKPEPSSGVSFFIHLLIDIWTI